MPLWFVPLLLLSSCSPGYVIRAAYEEGKILWRRKPIVEVLEREDLDSVYRAKFETVLGVRKFARDHLDLRVGGSYASYSRVDRPVLAHLLTAVPKTEFEPYTWWFLFVGRVPYKGYFDRSEAEEEGRGLEGRGYDTHIRPVSAFSTLGWFDDPLLEHLLRLDRVRLADVIIHELFHGTLFVSGSVAFNESLANFVGKRAAIAYFADRHGPASAEARMAGRIWDDERQFSRFLMQWVDCLKMLYGSELPEREKLQQRSKLFDDMQRAWRTEIAGRKEHAHSHFGGTPLNNAVLMQHYLYVNDLQLFETLYERTGRNLHTMIEQIRDVTESGERPYESVAGLLDGSRLAAPPGRGPCPNPISHSVEHAP